MMSKKNILIAVGAATGLTVVAWRTLFPWIGYDLQLLNVLSRSGKAFEADIKARRFFIDNFEDKVKQTPKKPFIAYADRYYTYEFVNEQACRVANIVSSWNLRKGDAVAIFLYNSPDFIWIFLGLQKLGVVTSLLNINTKGETLLHCIKSTDIKAVIVGKEADLFDNIDSVKSQLDIPVYVIGKTCQKTDHGYQSWDQLMISSSPAEVCPSVRNHLDMLSVCCYAFTSGTTGLPKTVLVYNWRMASFSKLMKAVNATPNDVIYDVLPFYHLTGTSGWMSAVDTGCTVAIRPKFSATHFLDDCRKYNVRIFLYFGELCRYLLALPEGQHDKTHSIRVMIGIGLRKDIFTSFLRRFGIREIVEYYGASESPVFLGNVAGKPGAIGRVSPFLSKTEPISKYVVKCDIVDAKPIRDKNGRCIPVKIGEPGLLIGAIPPQYKGTFYKGSREMNEKKIVRDVFHVGDAFFNTGDMVFLDKDYFAYFYDRLGDTFRWKGENVSTTEVANIITTLTFVQDANVYGVFIPGHDGKAGMASIVLASNEQPTTERLKAIYLHCNKNLPKYAIPLVLRFEKETKTTSTFKQRKLDLVKEGFDPKVISDPMFYFAALTGNYIPLDTDSYDRFLQSKL